MKHSVTFLILVIVSTLSLQAQLTYSAKTDFSVGSAPWDVISCDLNGDGMPDIATANYGASSISVLLNTTTPGASVPSYAAKVDFTTGASPYSIDFSDVNGDGKTDIAVANYSGATISVLLNTTASGATTPTFSSKTDFLAGSDPQSITLDDLNGDGREDVVVANPFANTISVLFNTTTPGAVTPSFSARTTFSTATYPIAVATGDLNGDGKIDIASANLSSHSISVFLSTTSSGDVTPTYSLKTDFGTGTNPNSISIADCNGDGKPDIATGNNSSYTISILINTTTLGAAVPAFLEKSDTPTIGNLYLAPLEDCNGDGKPDFATANASNNTVSLLLNTTTPGASIPTYTTITNYTSGNYSTMAVFSDCNGDGKKDMLVVNYYADSVSVLMNTSPLGVSPLTYSMKTNFTTGTHPSAVAVGDLNGDGMPDIAVADNGADSVSVLMNTTSPGASTPSNAAAVRFPTGSSPSAVTIVDLNGDGNRDMAVANYSGTGKVSVFFNTTTPGAAIPAMSAKTDFSTGSLPFSIVSGDVNGDGKNDLATANRSGTISVLLNTTVPGASTPSFAAKTDFAAGNDPISICIGDLNGDGKPDLSVVNKTTNLISVLLNTTTPGASAATFTVKNDFTTGAGPRSIGIGDLNGDGKPDLVSGNYDANTVSIIINTTTPGETTASFAGKVDFATDASPTSVAIGDCNGEGKPDIATSNDDNKTMSVLLNTTTPGSVTPLFAAKTDFSAGNYPQSIAIGDVNSDGRPDLIVANYFGGGISVVLNTAVIPLPVELVSFTVSTNRLHAELKWTTATEVNNYGFEIEKREKGEEKSKMWGTIGFVDGNGTTNSPKEYLFADNNLSAGKYLYRLKQIDRDGKFEYSKEVEVTIGSAPLKFELAQNYPNPFNPTTTISFTLQVSGLTTLKVYDVIGREVATVFHDIAEAGEYHQAKFDGRNLSSGIYFAKLQTGGMVQIKKMLLQK